MNKLIYTTSEGKVCVVHPAPKANVEAKMGKLTDAQYKKHVIARSIPEGVTYRELADTDIPASREFRNAWVDVTTESRIDICCEKARDLKLGELRAKRNKKLAETDVEMTRALEQNDTAKRDALKTIRQNLRNITDPLKALNVTGKVNDEALLEEIKRLSELPE
jgi:hypothetical protein